MVAKIVAAVAMPLLVATLVGALLTLFDRTAVPPLELPAMPSANNAVSAGSPTSAQINSCAGKVPARFSGIAVPHQPAVQLAGYRNEFAAGLQVVEFYDGFKQPFARAEAEQAVQAGLIPLIQLNPWGVSERQIAAGVWDRHLRNYANAVKALGCTVILSFGHEMNAWWYPWGRPETTPSEFIAAWRHIHEVFAKQGVRNVIWSWDPSQVHGVLGAAQVATPASQWYPGSRYVDWIGLDGYLGHGTNGRAQTFGEIFGFQLTDIRKFAAHKKVYLAETGVAPGPTATAQIIELFRGAAAYDLAGVVWFDAIAKHDYRLGVPSHAMENAAYGKSVRSFLNLPATAVGRGSG